MLLVSSCLKHIFVVEIPSDFNEKTETVARRVSSIALLLTVTQAQNVPVLSDILSSFREMESCSLFQG